MLKLTTLSIELMGEEYPLEVEWDEFDGRPEIATAIILKRFDYDKKGVYYKNGYWERLDITPILNRDQMETIIQEIVEDGEKWWPMAA